MSKFNMRVLSIASLFCLVACADDKGPDTMLDKVTIPANLPATTVPIVLEGDQILVGIEAEGPGGRSRKILVNLNTGGAFSGWQSHVYDEIGFVPHTPVQFRIGGIPVEVAVGASFRGDDSDYPDRQFWPFFFTHRVEGTLQCGILEHFDVALDYVDKTLTVATPGTLAHEGIPIPIRVNDKTGLVTVEFIVDGKPYPIVVDVGSAYTWVRPSVAAKWVKDHPDWERARGAVGTSNYNMLDLGTEKDGIVMRVPSAALGSMSIRNVGLLGTGNAAAFGFESAESFMDEWQKSAPEPVIGWLGANVLKHYRLTIDYKNHMSYWLKKSDIDPHELDQVGVTLVYDKGEYLVGAIVTKDKKPTVEGLQAGDRILAIDGKAVQGWSRDQIFAALHGKAGDTHLLEIRRHGKQATVSAPVTEF